MDRNRTVTEIEGAAPQPADSAPLPFSDSGADDGTVPARCGDERSGQGKGADAERTTQGEAACATVTLPAPCRCGAPAHATDPGICSRGHALPGNRRTLRHGLYSMRPDDADADARADAVASAGDPWWRYDWQREMFVEVGGRLSDLLESMRGRTRALSVANMKLCMGLLREMNQVGADIEASKPSRERVSESEHLQRVARVALRHPEAFIAMLIEAVAIDPGVAAVLRAAIDAHDAAPPPPQEADAAPVMQVPDGVPRPVLDEPDEVLL
jgi:hypothetical protein